MAHIHPAQPTLIYQQIGAARNGRFQTQSPQPSRSAKTPLGRWIQKLVKICGVMALAVATLLGVGSMAAEPPVPSVPTAIAR